MDHGGLWRSGLPAVSELDLIDLGALRAHERFKVTKLDYLQFKDY